jgi:hypothetical protein
MLKRSTVVTLALLALVAGLYWYSQQSGNVLIKVVNTGATPASLMLGTLISPDYTVTGMKLEAASGQNLSIQPQNNTWIVTTDSRPAQPGTGNLANPDDAQFAIRNVQALRLLAKVDASTDLAAFGLDKPAYVLTCSIADGTTLTFKIGNITVTQNGYYVLAEDGTIVIVSTFEIDDLTRLLSEPPFLNTATPAPADGTKIPELTATKTP